ncbi:MAG: cation:proton antiporter [Flavipsychrobacter sp.]|nr:cation:proton antiporter [Flavipsychrobacter sp.]
MSSVVIISYIFNIISRKTRIPSVLLLIATGLAIRYTAGYYGYVPQDVQSMVKILGAIGLIMIVLEAALDLKVNRDKLPLIRDSFLSALIIFLISAFGIGFLIQQWLNVSFEYAFIYAVPLSIISSAIVIPSTSHLPALKKEFIIYESSFSDIIGILVFNYMLMRNVMSFRSAAIFTGNVGLAILVSLLASLMLIYILTKIKINLKFFLLFAILTFIYSAGELIHLPSLLIVLVFGLILNNSELAFIGRLRKLIEGVDMSSIVGQMHSITAETSFLIRTFFFILFGYSIELSLLLNPIVWQLGSAIVIILIIVRFLYLRLILKSNLFPEILLSPRGLVTILLFYNIPEYKRLESFDIGILFFVVVVTSLLMMVGLLFFKSENKFLETSDEHF